MNKDNGKCSVKRCRNESYINDRGAWLCKEHYEADQPKDNDAITVHISVKRLKVKDCVIEGKKENLKPKEIAAKYNIKLDSVRWYICRLKL